ncbi:DUF445 domain-containing protein [Rhodospirillaceae bacterium SYSU D60014]|uniref:DUF445 domain-containing protein n=1 Tax=Virgifigura deserti TaxID=2268457 RepID=UPI0013C4B6F3
MEASVEGRRTGADGAPGSESAQRRGLRRHRLLATGLLFLMGAVFVATKFVAEPGIWVLLVQAGAEAALVGGLADWFAVTALFRHPLGLPIPHTAIVPRNKDRIGEGLGRFVERNFLAPDLVAQKVRSIDIAARLSAWLADPKHADVIADRMVSTLPYMIESIEDQDVREFIRRALDEQLRTVNLAPALGNALEVLAEAGHHQALFDRALVIARKLLFEYEGKIYELVGKRSSWWIPRSIDGKVARSIMAGIHELLDELAEPNHEARGRVDRAVIELVDKLQHSPEYATKVQAIKDQVLANPAIQGYLGVVWDELRRMIVEDAIAPDSTAKQAIAGGLRSLGRALAEDRRIQNRVNRTVERFLMKVVVPWRVEIGRFIAEVVRGWDARTVSDRMELAVGRDLQYIRMNGTLVGALVGCVLFVLSEWVF